MNEIKRKLKISRDIWLRGDGELTSKLLRKSDQKMCCVGIYLEACGVPREKLEELGAAHSLKLTHLLPDEADWLLNSEDHNRPSDLAKSLYESNDIMSYLDYDLSSDESYDEDRREQEIASLFLRAGVEVEFV